MNFHYLLCQIEFLNDTDFDFQVIKVNEICPNLKKQIYMQYLDISKIILICDKKIIYFYHCA